MVKHIVCYKFAQPDADVLAKTKEVFESMVGRVPEVKSLSAGIDGAGSDLRQFQGYGELSEERISRFGSEKTRAFGCGEQRVRGLRILKTFGYFAARTERSYCFEPRALRGRGVIAGISRRKGLDATNK